MAAIQPILPGALFNWLSTDDVLVLDLRDEGQFLEAHVCGAYRCWLGPTGQLQAAPAPGSGVPAWNAHERERENRERAIAVCVGDGERPLREHPVYAALERAISIRELRVLSAPGFADFTERYGSIACAGAVAAPSRAGAREGHTAATRLLPSEVVPGSLFLCDLAVAAQLAHRRDIVRGLRIARVLTVMAEPPAELGPLRAQAGQAGAPQLSFFGCHDATGADIKVHFAEMHRLIDEAAASGCAVLVHCSKGVSRSATVVIAHQMRSGQLPALQAGALVRACRRIVCPNPGFERCLLEFEKELHGLRSGVYVPRPVVDSGAQPEFALPPRWAARAPVHPSAELRVLRGGEELERLGVGAHVLSVFGRSVTADVPCEHASISRRHCALVQHAAGGFYALDLGSTHGSFVNGARLLPFAEVRLAAGDVLSLGASSRSYALLLPPEPRPGLLPAGQAGPGLAAEMADSDDDADEEAEAGQPGAPTGAEPKAGAKRGRRWEKRSVRRLRQIVAPKPLTENERVALKAGQGSGCFGPG